jgi:hypothetical protein
MKKTLLLIMALMVVASVMCTDFMLPGPLQKVAAMREPMRLNQPTRVDSFEVSFSVNPVTLVMSYYDYMIGSYNDLPVVVQPDPTYGGYFLTFHGQRTLTSQRRVFYAYLSDNGTIENMNEITSVQNREGYPGMACDPVSGKPIYAWHANADTDTQNEIQYAYDAFLFGAAGLISNPEIVIDNPITIQPFGTTDNEFIWPTVKIGPSPTTGMRRVYILGRNYISHAANTSPSENAYIAYADFNADMLEMGSPLTWSYTSIPTLDEWNHATDLWRRPNFAFTVGEDGRIYYVGYHIGLVMSDSGTLVEPDLDAFVCDNYGEGTWTRVTGSSKYPSWNPQYNYGSGDGYFTGNDAVTPVPSDSLFWSISNSSHLNAVLDTVHGKINLAGIWAQQFDELVDGVLNQYYHPSLQTVKNLTYDINEETFAFREIYPIAGESSDAQLALPWDMDGDGLVDEYYTNPDDPNDVNNGTPLMNTWWPFPYWDQTAAGDAMMFHYSNVKITPPNEQGMMACVWQDSERARLYNLYPTSYPEYADYADTPEIYISVSNDYGVNWTLPETLNKVETPELANMKPMWVYPADKIEYIGESAGHPMGTLGILFYDDNSWGSYQQTPPAGQNDGGYVKFMELTLAFPVANDDENGGTPTVSMLKQNYPNPFNPETVISFNLPKAGAANLGIYNSKGQLVRTLSNGLLDSGNHRLTWNGKDDNGNNTASGLYFYKLSANGRTETRKMLLMK